MVRGLFLAGVAAVMASMAPMVHAQVTATLPTTCTPSGICTRATAIVNPDGTNVASIASTPPQSINTGQPSIGTTSTLVVAARPARRKVTISVDTANTCAFGNSGVTLTTGFKLQPVAGASLTLDTAAAVYGACSATTTTPFIELY